jgi:hypothetical protein
MNPAIHHEVRQQEKVGLPTGDGEIALCCTVLHGTTRRKELLCPVLFGWRWWQAWSPDN